MGTTYYITGRGGGKTHAATAWAVQQAREFSRDVLFVGLWLPSVEQILKHTDGEHCFRATKHGNRLASVNFAAFSDAVDGERIDFMRPNDSMMSLRGRRYGAVVLDQFHEYPKRIGEHLLTLSVNRFVTLSPESVRHDPSLVELDRVLVPLG